MSSERDERLEPDAVQAAKASRDPLDVALAALAVVENIEGQLTGIAKRLDGYAVYGRRSRHIIIGLAISFVVDIALTIFLGVTAVNAHNTVSDLHAASVSQCVSGNQFRTDQDRIWTGFVSILAKPSPGESAADKQKTAVEAAAFLKFVRAVNATRNCAAIYGTGT